MDKSIASDYKKQIKENKKILRDMNIVSKARIKFGADNKSEVLNYLKAKYEEENGNRMVEEYWNSLEKRS